jgi:hypothetical protein
MRRKRGNKKATLKSGFFIWNFGMASIELNT